MEQNEEAEKETVEGPEMTNLANKDNQNERSSSSNERSSPSNRISFQYDYPANKSHKGLFLIIAIFVGFGVAGFLFRSKVNNLFQGVTPTPSPEALETSTPTSTPEPLIRVDWSFEVLNGSGESGLAKKVAGQLQELGYQVIKTGNASSSSYAQTEILVREGLLEKIDLVIADLKDTIKIASVAGQLKEGTASARIIIGKDSI